MARSATFQSRTFGRDPADLYEAQQEREQRESRRVGEAIGKRWSSARQAAEDLFDLPPRPVLES